MLQLLLTSSVVLLLATAGLGIWLAQRTGRLVPWALVAGVVAVTAVWRGVVLFRVHVGAAAPPSVGSELTVAFLALLLLVGFSHTLRRFLAAGQATAHAWRHDRRLSSLVENALDVVTVIDARGTILYVSPSVRRTLGRDPETETGRDVFELIHPEDQAGMRAFLESRIDKPGVAPLIECRIRHQNGVWCHFEVAGTNLLADSGVGAIIINARDVTERKETEAALRASEQRFRALVENSWDVFALVNRDGVVQFMSPSVRRALGHGPHEFVGKWMFDFVHPDDMLKVGLAFQEILSAPGQSAMVEVRGRHADGEYRWLEAVGTNLLDDPEVGAIVGIFRDKTERRRIEEVLRTITEGVSAATGAEFFHSMVVLLTQVLGLRYAVVSKAASGKPDTVVTLAVADGGEILENFEYALEGTPCATVFGHQICSYPSGVRERFPQDQLLARLEAESYLGTPLFDSTAAPLGVMAVMDTEPLTDEYLARATLEIFAARAAAELERERTLEALQDSEASNRELVEHAAYGIYRSTRDGRFVSVNPAMVRLLGYESEDELLAVDMAADVYADSTLRERLIALYVEEERVDGVEVEWKRRDGSRVLVRLSGKPVRGAGGEIEAFDMVAEDVTERRALEEQLRQAQKMEAIGQLTGGIAHDFNNLLTVILANADVIERGLHPDQADMGSDLTDLRRAAQRGSDMVRKLLGYSRRGMLVLRPVKISGVIANLLPTLRRILPESIDVRFLPRAAESIVSADEGALEQILFNLATNARDAMPEGGVLRIEITRVRADGVRAPRLGWGAPPGEYILVSVSDTGQGMDEETKERIYDPFFTTKPTGQGTGLGMAMIYGLVKQQAGYIDVNSREAEGTTVDLYFPLAETEPRGGDEAVEVETAPGTETVLLVEDEAAIRRAAKRLLEKAGYSVLLAHDGLDALDVFTQHGDGIDLVISDVVMPRLGGRGLYEELRRRGQQVRFLFTSGYTVRDVRDTESIDPRWPFVQKPWDIDELLLRVRDLLDSDPPPPTA
jgi:PAS domain S-box-containing protein